MPKWAKTKATRIIISSIITTRIITSSIIITTEIKARSALRLELNMQTQTITEYRAEQIIYQLLENKFLVLKNTHKNFLWFKIIIIKMMSTKMTLKSTGAMMKRIKID